MAEKPVFQIYPDVFNATQSFIIPLGLTSDIFFIIIYQCLN
ncbi:hypothetical protein XIS1_400008 [Xenorhabdus innexi]|uniref:Uncharacterized protein n=1 Tax=Xenorhabdus innexi TaxID=290109 RepID=A0A1N6MY06_9GAMM|nr:hypothetical protein XIS1_400008 [Xenorhabdus innexi]